MYSIIKKKIYLKKNVILSIHPSFDNFQVQVLFCLLKNTRGILYRGRRGGLGGGMVKDRGDGTGG